MKKSGKTWIRRKMCTFYAFSETDQIYSHADCKKSNDRIYSTPVPNKILWISASFKLCYLIVAQLLLEIFKNKIVPWTNTQCAKCTFFSDFMFYQFFFQIARIYTIFNPSLSNTFQHPSLPKGGVHRTPPLLSPLFTNRSRWNFYTMSCMI